MRKPAKNDPAVPRYVETGVAYREGRILFDTEKGGVRADGEARTVEVAFSSETPLERYWGTEILDHDPKSVMLERIGDGRGPLLRDHSTREQIGVIERASIDPDRVGRATVRFGKSPRAEEEFQDVLDGIRSQVSVGYRIHEMRLESVEKDREVYRATRWEPLEISTVAIAAHPPGGGC